MVNIVLRRTGFSLVFRQCQRQARRRACSASVNATVPKDSLVSRRSHRRHAPGARAMGDAADLRPSTPVTTGGGTWRRFAVSSALPFAAGSHTGRRSWFGDGFERRQERDAVGAGGAAVFEAPGNYLQTEMTRV